MSEFAGADVCWETGASVSNFATLPVYYIGYVLYRILMPLVMLVHWVKSIVALSWMLWSFLLIPNIFLLLALAGTMFPAIAGVVLLITFGYGLVVVLPVCIVFSPVWLFSADMYASIIDWTWFVGFCPAQFSMSLFAGPYDNFVFFRCLQHATYFEENCDGRSWVWSIVEDMGQKIGAMLEDNMYCENFYGETVCVSNELLDVMPQYKISRAMQRYANTPTTYQTETLFQSILEEEAQSIF